MAWAHGTVGLGDDCTPSALPRSGRDDEYLSHWLDQGYVVVGSDYAGLGTPGLMSYLNSVTTARGVVDSVLAAHHMDLPLSPKWAVVGQSQGGGAAGGSAAAPNEGGGGFIMAVGSFSILLIVGAVIGLVVLAAVIGLIVWLCARQKQE